MGKKWSSKELTDSIKKKVLETSLVAMTDGLALLQQNLTKGQSFDGSGVKPYSSGYDKKEARSRAISGAKKQKNLSKARKSKSNKTINNGAVDWLLTGSLRRGMRVQGINKPNQYGAEIVVNGKHYSGLDKAKLLEYLQKDRPNLWGFSQKGWDTIINIFKKRLKL